MGIATLRRFGAYAGMAGDAFRLRTANSDEAARMARQRLVDRMGAMRGLPQKLGQMLSFSNHDAADDFAALQQQAEPLPIEQVLPILESAWRRPSGEILQHIDENALAASLGQVHHARLQDGRQVAIKVQYPGIREAIATDLKMLGWLSAPVGNLRRGFDLQGYRETMLQDLERELDYRAEARNQAAFRSWADPFVVTPGVVEELSNDHVLVSEWRTGDDWQTVVTDWTATEKEQLAQKLTHWFVSTLFERGLMHADLHPGNVRFLRAEGRVRILLYDFGCVYRPSETERLGLMRLIRATIYGNEPVWPLFLQLGFDEEHLEPISGKLPELAKLLFEPFLKHDAFDSNRWRLSERMHVLLGDDRWNLRLAGPPALVFLLRSFHGLLYYLRGLDAKTQWRRSFEACLNASKTAINNLQLPNSRSDAGCPSPPASHLKIRVTENGNLKVQLTCVPHAIDDLDTLLDHDLKARIASQNIDLDAKVLAVRQRGYTPGPVFQMTEGAKKIRVWME